MLCGFAWYLLTPSAEENLPQYLTATEIVWANLEYTLACQMATPWRRQDPATTVISYNYSAGQAKSDYFNIA